MGRLRKPLLLLLLVVLAGAGCTYDPVYQGTRCGEDRACPSGYVCAGEGETARCQPVSSGGDEGGTLDPDADGGTTDDGSPADQDQPDGDAESDAADDSADVDPCAIPDKDHDGQPSEDCNGTDCDDTRIDVYLGAPEECDGVDNDCDGLVDVEDDDFVFAPCEKQHGVCADLFKTADMCVAGAWGACPFDHYAGHDPAYEETEASCDGLDNDCDGQVDSNLTAPPCDKVDGVCAGSTRRCLGLDGWQPACEAPEYGPDYEDSETRCDGLDNDCDGVVDLFTRACTVVHLGACAVGEETCDAGSWAGCPEPEDELCDPPGIDEDCDGSVDEDCGCQEGAERPCPLQAGVCAGARELCVGGHWAGCDYQAHAAEYELPPETLCDNLDNDCDGTTDGMLRACSENHQGWCGVGMETCTAGVFGGCNQPEQEVCDDVDNDCDGELDAADGDLVLEPCELDVGVCAGGQVHLPARCVGGLWQFCDASEYGPGYQIDEDCEDGLDNNCNGETDCEESTCDGHAKTCWNDCLPGQETCVDGTWTACNAPNTEEERERNGNCDDGLDNDCDGHTDSDDGECCNTVGETGKLLLLVGLPWLQSRRRRRRRFGGESGMGS